MAFDISSGVISDTVYFVEVKYRHTIDKDDILKNALEIAERWELCHLFVVSKDGFYFSPISKVIAMKGELESLLQNWVHTDIQEKYKQLVYDFLLKHEYKSS